MDWFREVLHGYPAKLAIVAGTVIGVWLFDWPPAGVLPGLAIGFVIALVLSNSTPGDEHNDAGY